MTDERATQPSSVGRASALLASGTFVSRALGFVSAAALAWTIGQQNQGANAFAIANQLPNNIYAIVAGGLLSAVLVPQIVRAAHHEDGGQKFVNRVVTLGIVIFLGVTLLATLCAPLLVPLYAAEGRALSGEGIALAVSFAYWCLPQIFFYALYSLFGEILNARGVFGPFTWAPVLNNVVVIASLVFFVTLFQADPANRDPSSLDTGQDRAARRRRDPRCRRPGARAAGLLAPDRTRIPPRLPLEGRRPRRHRPRRRLDLRHDPRDPARRDRAEPRRHPRRRGRPVGRGAPNHLAHLHAAALDRRGLDRDPVLHPDERARPRRRPRLPARRHLRHPCARSDCSWSVPPPR